MSYFPLDVINNLKDLELTNVDKIFEQCIKEKTNQDIKIDLMGDPEFMNYCFGEDFLNPYYKGKFEILNDFLLYNKELHKICLPSVKFKDLEQRQTEWRDMFGQSYVLQLWTKSKVVYKVDHDFFHEIKQTKNLKFSTEMLSHLPVNTMYFDLSDVKGIGQFNGAWVHVHEVKPNYFLLVIYMIMKENHAFFSYYCGFNFYEVTEIEYDIKEFFGDEDRPYYYQDFSTDMQGHYMITQHNLDDNEDYRPQIVTAICQILEFLHAQIEDVSESPVTKSTYKPSTVIKNKFSEVRMWDVGIRYGKAIRFAQEQMNEEVKKAEQEDVNEVTIINKKKRKPVRPHIRSAHWQRYHVGEGRTQIKVNWIPPVYVCGTKEIPVTIHKVGA